MFKKLDILILKAFTGPFIATFFITLMVLVMQFFWLWIDDFVGKGIEALTILEFISYQSVVLVPLALPLSILLSSLMTFGNLGESFELVAIKAAGISLLRFMRPIFLFSILISAIAFFLYNNVIPVAVLKSKTLLGDIVYAKPAFSINEGVFYDGFDGFSIKIGKKENDSIIHDVIVYEHNNSLQDNFTIAQSGVMRTTPDKRFLEFILRDGWRYEERGTNNYGTANTNTDYIRMGFKEYKKQFDLSTFGFSLSQDSSGRNNEKMFSIRQLNIAIDSLQKESEEFKRISFKSAIYTLNFYRYLDSTWKESARIVKDTLTAIDSLLMRQDSLLATAGSIQELLPDSARVQVNDRIVDQARNVSSSLRSYSELIKPKEKNIRRHNIEWHKKIAFSLSCVVLFMIGAPLGSIIRKGGLGTPLLIAIGFFMLFYFVNTTGEKFAKEGELTPLAGVWLATFVLLPIGIFLTYKAMQDSQLFNKEAYMRFFKKIQRLFKKK